VRLVKTFISRCSPVVVAAICLARLSYVSYGTDDQLIGYHSV